MCLSCSAESATEAISLALSCTERVFHIALNEEFGRILFLEKYNGFTEKSIFQAELIYVFFCNNQKKCQP